jgi:DNA-binding transcriptional MerR regulator
MSFMTAEQRIKTEPLGRLMTLGLKLTLRSLGFLGRDMRIGELAKISGLAPSRIRFYEASGLIKSVERKANGYRDYAPDTEWVLEIITGAQAAGFSLEEIRQLMPMNASGWQHDQLLSGLKQKVEEIEVLQQRLAQNKEQLLLVIKGIEGKPEGMACADNAQLLINRLREEGVTPASGKRAAASSKKRTAREASGA